MLDNNDNERSPSAHSRGDRPSGSGQANDTASRAVLQVAEVLDEEIEASGSMPQFVKPQSPKDDSSVDRKDFTDVLLRFSGDAHDLIDVVSDEVSDFSSLQATKIVKRLRVRAHKAVDFLTKLAFVAPSVFDELLRETKKRRS